MLKKKKLFVFLVVIVIADVGSGPSIDVA